MVSGIGPYLISHMYIMIVFIAIYSICLVFILLFYDEL
jgi:hypothetical protein